MSSPEDLRRVHQLRASVNGIMVGFRTLIVDDPKLTVKYVKGHKPHRIIVDSKAETPLKSYVVRTARKIPTIIAITSKAPKRRIEDLRRKGVTTVECGKGPKVSLKILFKMLGRLGLDKILLEGGGTLNWSMLRNGLVDEISVAITPRILGGAEAVSLAEGEGSRLVEDAVKLKLLGTARYGPDLVVHYKVLG